MHEAVIDTIMLIYDTFKDSLYHRNTVSLLDMLNRWLIPMIVVFKYVEFLKGLFVDTRIVYEKVFGYMTDEKPSYYEGDK
ncbi:MAG: hypothetical protein QW291_08665 [Thermofilaceae archaeon]